MANTIKKNETSVIQAEVWDETKIKLVKSIAARDATNDEFALLYHIANKYNLDPLVKEIWCIKRSPSSPALIMTSRDGYLKIAHASGKLDGLQSGADIQKDIAWCEVWRKDMTHSFRSEIRISEYKQTGNPVWAKYPSAMAIKVAEVFTLKRAFSISGMLTEDEMGTHEDGNKEIKSEKVVTTKEQSVNSTISQSDKLRKRIFAMGNDLGLDSEQTKETCKKIFKTQSFNDLTEEQLEAIVIRLQKKVDTLKQESEAVEQFISEGE